MRRNAAIGLTCRIFLSGTSMAAGTAAYAGNIAGMAPTSRCPQIMVYVSQPLWSSGTSFRVYGLRVETVRAQPTSPQSAGVGFLRRSELLDLQIVPHSDIRIGFARRLIWDFTQEAFGPQSSLSIVLPIKRLSSPDPARLQPWDLRASGLSLMAGSLVPDPRAVAAAVVTLQWTPSAGKTVTAVSGLAISSPLSHICSLWTCPVSASSFHSSSFDH